MMGIKTHITNEEKLLRLRLLRLTDLIDCAKTTPSICLRHTEAPSEKGNFFLSWKE